MNFSENINVLTVAIIFTFFVKKGNASQYNMHIICN